MIATTPNPGGGTTKLQVDRFDPLSGWQFHHIVRLPVRFGSTTVTWVRRRSAGGGFARLHRDDDVQPEP